MLLAAGRAIPVLARHFASYAELAALEARDAAGIIKRRMVMGVVALLTAHLAVVLALVWIIAATWNTPWRTWTLAGLTLAFAAIAAIAGSVAVRAGERVFGRLRLEWAADRELLKQFTEAHRETVADDAAAAEPAADTPYWHARRGNGPGLATPVSPAAADRTGRESAYAP